MSTEKNNLEEKADSEPSASNDLANNTTEEKMDHSIETTEIKNQNLGAGAIHEIRSQHETLQSHTNNMEVHHHPHVHHSKKWKDYLYEFVMLFFAVTAGFFVENRREYYIEHERANQFSRQLLADLRLDSLMFEYTTGRIQNMQNGHDKLLYLLVKKNDATDKEILETLLPITFVFDFPATTTTYNQMKTSGSLRYIENQDATAHLQHYYDVLLPGCIKIADASLAYFSENIVPFYLKHIRIQDYDPFNDTLINKNPFDIGT